MLRALKSIIDYQIAATDGAIGKVCDFYFDDARWVVRYLVADTSGFWHQAHRVLISPVAFQRADWLTRTIELGLTKDLIESCPSADLEKPVSRQYELSYHRHYGWAPYWGFGESWSFGPGEQPANEASSEVPKERLDPGSDTHLRSMTEVAGYQVNGGETGHELLGEVYDFIVDEESWTIRYLVLDTSRWLFGKKVLVAPHWAQEISWSERNIHTKITRDTITHSPAWDPRQPVNREYETRLLDYYGRPAYWAEHNDQHVPALKPMR